MNAIQKLIYTIFIMIVLCLLIILLPFTMIYSIITGEEMNDGMFTDKVGKCCAIGHYTRLRSVNPKDYGESNCIDIENIQLRDALAKYLHKIHSTDISITTINNSNEINRYTEPEIKDRVIHLFEDMVAAGY